VHSAMGRSQPSREMPGFDFGEAAIDAYKAIPLHIRQIFAEYTPIIEPLSLDEAYLDVTENLKGIRCQERSSRTRQGRRRCGQDQCETPGDPGLARSRWGSSE
jgi:nucleotidyltransferase/DNA polymerase involved in DNA repair